MFIRVKKFSQQRNDYQDTDLRTNDTVRVVTINEEPSMAQEQFKDQCDVNKIMAKYKKEGLSYNNMPHAVGGISGDFTSVTDYQTMLNKVMNAQDSFNSLPADIRDRFKNDPSQLLAFVGDEANYEEGVKLGLFNKRPDQIKNAPPENDNSKPKQKQKTGDANQKQSDE